MKLVVVGGSGVVGSRIVAKLRETGHDAVAASTRSGVDTLTGAGLAAVLDGARIVVDASNAPASGDPGKFFADSTRTLLAAESSAGVRHHVVVSIVGVDRLNDTSYFRGKLAQEELVRTSGIPFSIARSTQFLEFIDAIARAHTEHGVVRLPPIFIQPIAVDDAAAAIAKVALGEPLNGTTEIAGPERLRLDELVARTLAVASDPRRVIADENARYFGARVNAQSLLPSR